jgi:hypothetical protein
MKEMIYYYVLYGKIAVRTTDLTEWAKKFEENRQVAKDHIGDACVSTVFLGMDHQYYDDEPDAPPMLFETIIFGGEHDESLWRYSTWEQAEQGHKKVCDKLREELN